MVTWNLPHFSFQAAFQTPGYAFVKTGVMMIGEIEFEDLFHGEASDFETEMYYEGITYFIFITFLCVATIIIMNLLVSNLTIPRMTIYVLLILTYALPTSRQAWQWEMCRRFRSMQESRSWQCRYKIAEIYLFPLKKI